MPEGPPGPCGVCRDLNNHGFYEGQRHGFLVPVESVQGRAFHNGRPGVLAHWGLQPACQFPAFSRLQWCGASDDSQLAVQDQAGDDLGGLGNRVGPITAPQIISRVSLCFSFNHERAPGVYG